MNTCQTEAADDFAGDDDTRRTPAQKRRMLVVDDSPVEHVLIANMFGKSFDVYKAFDGESALDLIRHYGTAISVVLLDLIMPGIDGFKVLQQMQESQELRNIPVIVVRGAEDQHACIRAIRAGAMDYVDCN